MKYLAIDYGLKYTGIAVSDALGILVFPRQRLVMTTRVAFYSQLVEIIHSENPDALVVGLPVLFDGSETLITKQVYNFVKRLLRRVELPLFLMKETLSTYAATLELKEAGCKLERIESVIDQQTAVCILRSFLAQPEEKRIGYAYGL